MPTLKLRLLALTLLFAVVESQALTLGRLRGAAIVGQGLDVSVQIQTDPDEGPANLCLEAEVFHADARLDGSRVQVAVEPTQTPQSFNVRIQSSVAVDEPVVTVYLRAGCSQKSSRRYVMLADVVSDQAAPAAPRAPQALPLVVPAQETSPAAAGSGAAGGTGVRSSSAAAAGAAPRPAVAKPSEAAKPAPAAPPAAPVRKAAPAKAVTPSPSAPAPAVEKQAAARGAGQARLKLDPLEVLSERVATLESSSANAPAEQAARDARDVQRLQSLEASVKNLLAVATRNESNLTELRARLQQAESERFANPVVYGLAALLLLSLTAVAFLLGRRGAAAGSAGGNWWSGGPNAQNTVGASDLGTSTARRSDFSPLSIPAPLSVPSPLAPQAGPAAAAVPTPPAPQRPAPNSRVAPVTQVDVSLVEMSESTFDRIMQSGSTHSAVRKQRVAEAADTLPPQPPAPRLINSDDLFDIRQQAEFFVSLGQTDQAVRILENRIAESGESSPLAYLDLLKIFHSLGLKADFRQVREDFNLLFNARVPEFASFDNEGRDIEAYPEIVDKLVKVWGQPEALQTIESLLFRDQWAGKLEPLDLAVFRDLLLLHAVAQTAPTLPDELVLASGRDIPRGSFSGAAVAPAGPVGELDLTLPTGPQVPVDDLPAVPSDSTEVDIDLSDLTEGLPSIEQVSAVMPATPSARPGNLIDFDLPSLPGAVSDKAPGSR